ncbi:hypothetical protein CC80DRAFT_508314 [Byssothecium circinans]|uniref:Uncharacterized protein n=1 Tax=Byssothecium circinans TaxID=147558 RepID=A0A6A5TGM5_9PLEO|nr:hypothetical protein CC80DRAFT_508314 [Byssothecium circinans]
MFIPLLFFQVPRSIFSLLIPAIVIPVAIIPLKSLLVYVENSLGMIGYWSAASIGVNSNSYTEDEDACNDALQLPPVFAAMGAAVGCFGPVMPGRSPIWFYGTGCEVGGEYWG